MISPTFVDFILSRGFFRHTPPLVKYWADFFCFLLAPLLDPHRQLPRRNVIIAASGKMTVSIAPASVPDHRWQNR